MAKATLNQDTATAIKNGPLSSSRCEEIDNACKNRASELSIHSGGVSMHQFMSEAEVEHVRQVWNTLPGASSFSSAFFCIKKRQDWHGNSID